MPEIQEIPASKPVAQNESGSSLHGEQRTKTGGRAFAKGNPGRAPGIKDRRADRKESLYQLLEFGAAGDERKGTKKLPPRPERIRELLTSPDHNVRLATERFFWEQDFGRPKTSIDVFHHSEVVDEAKERMKAFLSNGHASSNGNGHSNGNGAQPLDGNGQHPN